MIISTYAFKLASKGFSFSPFLKVLEIVPLRCLHIFEAEDHFKETFNHVTYIHKSALVLYLDFPAPLDFSKHTLGFF